MLLLGAHPTQEIKDAPPEQLNAANLKTAPELKGDKVDILVAWKANGQDQQIHAEEWVHNQSAKATMSTGPWIYTSSALYKGSFLAQEEGSLVALVIDPAALINNPRPGNRDDTIWSVEKEKVPPVNTPVEIIFQILPDSSQSPSPSPK